MLRLKENPVEWIKFVAVMGLAVNLVVWLLWWRGRFGLTLPMVTGGVAVVVTVTAMIRPRWFRGFYRGGMTVSFHIGQVIGKLLLTLFFFLLVTPMGLLLRLLGKDLLQFRPKPGETSGWHQARNSRDFDRMF